VANSFYDSFLNGILGSHATRVDLDADTIKMFLNDNGSADGAPDAVNDNFYDDRDAGLIGTAYTLAAKTIGTVAVGVFDNTTDPAPAFTAVSGNSVETLEFFKDTGTPSTSDLICYFDTATGLPVTPNGGDINVTFNASGIFKV
jgi:hypothetical protein